MSITHASRGEMALLLKLVNLAGDSTANKTIHIAGSIQRKTIDKLVDMFMTRDEKFDTVEVNMGSKFIKANNKHGANIAIYFEKMEELSNEDKRQKELEDILNSLKVVDGDLNSAI
jgi:hypothetical protein